MLAGKRLESFYLAVLDKPRNLFLYILCFDISATSIGGFGNSSQGVK